MDIVIAAGALVMSVVFFVLAGQFPHLAADPGGLALFPRIAAVMTGAASAIFLVQVFMQRATRPSTAPRVSPMAFLSAHRSEAAIFVLVALLPFAIEEIGFVVAIALFTALILFASRVRLGYVVLTTALTTAGIYLAYATVLGAILPAGRLFN